MRGLCGGAWSSQLSSHDRLLLAPSLINVRSRTRLLENENSSIDQQLKTLDSLPLVRAHALSARSRHGRGQRRAPAGGGPLARPLRLGDGQRAGQDLFLDVGIERADARAQTRRPAARRRSSQRAQADAPLPPHPINRTSPSASPARPEPTWPATAAAAAPRRQHHTPRSSPLPSPPRSTPSRCPRGRAPRASPSASPPRGRASPPATCARPGGAC